MKDNKPVFLLSKIHKSRQKATNDIINFNDKEIPKHGISDITKLKNRLLKENITNERLLDAEQLNDSEVNNYEVLSKTYINDVFNHRLLPFVTRLIKCSVIPKEIELKYPILTIMLKICRLLLLNEMELCLFAIYIDRLGWYSENIEMENYLFCIAIITKMKSCSNSHYLINIIYKEIPILEQRLKELLTNSVENKNQDILNFSIKEINKKYQDISKISNTYCKEDCIDFNYCVDQLLSMSLPYSDKNKSMKKDKTQEESRSKTKDDFSEQKIIENKKTIVNENKTILNNPFAYEKAVVLSKDAKNDLFINIPTESISNQNQRNIEFFEKLTSTFNHKSSNDPFNIDFKQIPSQLTNISIDKPLFNKFSSQMTNFNCKL